MLVIEPSNGLVGPVLTLAAKDPRRGAVAGTPPAAF